MTPQYNQAKKILKQVRKDHPDVKMILGGPHAKYYPVQENWDHIVIGDGECALVGILLGSGQKIIRTEMSEYQMNQMPLPYREKRWLQQYHFDIQGHDASTIMTAKGCPMGCYFCEDAGTKVRKYTARNVGKQIQQVKDAGYDAVMFFDDLFCISEKRVHELAFEIRRHQIVYRCFGHARTMTSDMAAVLANSGCIEIGFGAESGSQKILDTINKKTTVEQNRRFVDLCNSVGIRVKAFMILGLPGETLETITETEKFLEYLMLKDNDFDMTVYYPYRGTHIRDNIDQYDLQIQDTGSLGYYKGKKGKAETIVRTRELSAEDITYHQQRLLREYK